MAKHNERAAEAGNEPMPATEAQAPETQARPADRLQQAQEKLARMEATQKLCFKYQNDLELLSGELKALKLNDFEITQILEPKGPRSLPGYLKSEIERQRQFVNYLSARVKPADSHAAGIEERQQNDSAPAL